MFKIARSIRYLELGQGSFAVLFEILKNYDSGIVEAIKIPTQFLPQHRPKYRVIDSGRGVFGRFFEEGDHLVFVSASALIKIHVLYHFLNFRLCTSRQVSVPQIQIR